MTYKSVICWASCYQIVKMSSFFSEGGVFIDGGIIRLPAAWETYP